MRMDLEATVTHQARLLSENKREVNYGLSKTYEMLDEIKYATTRIAEKMLSSGQGTLLMKMDKIKAEAAAALEEIHQQKPEMELFSITENGSILIERASEVYSRIHELQAYVEREVDSKSVEDAIEELGDLKTQLDTGINITLKNYTHLHERLEIYNAVKKELDKQRQRSGLKPSEHIEKDIKDRNRKLSGPSGFSR